MAKYNPKDNLNPEQRKEVAILLNAGIPHKELAEGYGISLNSIANISGQRRRWIPQEEIAKTQQQKLQYAQRVYASETLSLGAKRYIDHYVMDPIAAKIAQNLEQSLSQDPLRLLLRDIGVYTGKIYVDYSLLMGLALVALKQNVASGMQYSTIDDAVGGVAPSVMGLREAALTAEQKNTIDLLKSKVNEALAGLPQGQREAFELRYGIVDNHPRSFTEVAKELGGVTNQAARSRWLKAVRKLSHSNHARELKDLLK